MFSSWQKCLIIKFSSWKSKSSSCLKINLATVQILNQQFTRPYCLITPRMNKIEIWVQVKNELSRAPKRLRRNFKLERGWLQGWLCLTPGLVPHEYMGDTWSRKWFKLLVLVLWFLHFSAQTLGSALWGMFWQCRKTTIRHSGFGARTRCKI